MSLLLWVLLLLGSRDETSIMSWLPLSLAGTSMDRIVDAGGKGCGDSSAGMDWSNGLPSRLGVVRVCWLVVLTVSGLHTGVVSTPWNVDGDMGSKALPGDMGSEVTDNDERYSGDIGGVLRDPGVLVASLKGKSRSVELETLVLDVMD